MLRVFQFCWKKRLPTFFLIGHLVLFSACQTIERRIEQQSELFATFPPEVQQMIRAGEIDIGFTPEMVEIAWGPPDSRQVRSSEAEQTEVWTYLDRRSVYAGRRFAGYEYEDYYDHRTNTYQTIMRPVYVDVYRTVETERARVEFEDWKAASITRAIDR